MRIKFIVMMLSLLSILQISLISLFTFIRVEVDLGPRVNIVPCHLLTMTPIIGQMGLILASDWPVRSAQ